jgi:hypothetical protein
MLNAASSTDENVTPASAARALMRSHRGRSSVEFRRINRVLPISFGSRANGNSGVVGSRLNQ